jgi:hypothetical protein
LIFYLSAQIFLFNPIPNQPQRKKYQQRLLSSLGLNHLQSVKCGGSVDIPYGISFLVSKQVDVGFYVVF